MIYKGKEITPGLERISLLMERAGRPQDTLRVIHIAGTNGKGSTGAFIVSILQAAGYKVGHFHSPALISSREEIQIDGQWISEHDLGSCQKRLQEMVDPDFLSKAGQPSPFEMETAIAYLYFSEMRCDYAVIECGMGGRLDATNIVTRPAVSVITSISMDHMDYLGSTRQAIAAEKCGILKRGCSAAAIAEDASVKKVIEDTACAMGCSLCLISKEEISIQSVSVEEGQFFDFKDMQNLHIQNTAAYQPFNAALAITAVMKLKDSCIRMEHIREGLERMRWPARFEVISKKPLIIYDGAHNPDAITELKESIQNLLPGRGLIFIMGLFADKDYQEMLRILSSFHARLITFAPDSPRALSASDLAGAASGLFDRIYAATSLQDAWETAYRWHKEMDGDPAMIQCGTLSAYKEFRNIFTETDT